MAKAWQIQSVGCPNDSRHPSHQSTTLHLRFSFKLFWHFGFALPAKPMFLRILWIVVSRHWSWLPLLTPSCYVRRVLAIVNIQLSTWGCQQSQVSQAPMSGLLVFSFFFACPKTQQVVTGPFRRRLLALARRRCEGGAVGAEFRKM